jgi:hypothetical protein
MSSNLIERRDFLAMGLAFGTIAASAPPAFAQPAKEPKLTLHVLDVYSGKPAANDRSIYLYLRAKIISISRW